MREIDGLKVAFITSESYFSGFESDGLVRTQKKTGADVVILLAPGKTEEEVSDDDLRKVLSLKEEK